MPNPRRKKDEEKEQSSSSSSRVIKPSQKFAAWYNAGSEENALRNLAADMARARLNDPAIQQRNAWLREMEEKQKRLNADIDAYNDKVYRQNSAAALSNSLARGAYLGAAMAGQQRRSLTPSDLASVAGMVAKGNRERATDNYMSVVRNNFEVPDNGGNVRTYDWRYRNENWSRNIPDGGDRIREQYERDVTDWKKTNEAVDNYNAWVAQQNGKPYEGNGDPSKGLQSYLYLQKREEQRIADIERDQGINSLNRSYAFPDGGERSKAAYADFIEAMKRANNMAASDYAINEILGRTEEEPGTSMVHYNKYDSMSANAILNEWNRYKEKTAQDLEDAKKLLNITFPGVQSSGMEDIRNRLGALYGIDAYDAGELQSLVDDLEKGKIYLPDGSSTTYSILYNEASSRLPQSDLEEIARLRAMTSSEIKKQYESQDYTDHDTLQEDKNIVDFLLQNADVMRDYPEGSWEYDARERIRKAYDIDPQDEQALRDLSIKIGVRLINTPKKENNEIAFTDSNGTNYTWRNLYYEAENREQFGKMGNDEEALKLMTNGYALLRQINFYNSGVVDEYTARDALEKSEQLTPQLNSIKDQLSAMGYDFDRMAEYLDTEEAKQDFFMKLEADTAFATEHPGLASLYTVLLMPITSLEGIISLAGGIGSGNISTPIEEYVPRTYYNNYSTNTRDTIRAAAQNEIYNDILENTGNEKFASLVQKLYSGVMSVADSRMSLGLCSALFGPLGNDFVEWASLVMMGSSAAGEEFKQQIISGNSDNARMLMVSLAAGINEVLFEKLSLDKLLEGKEIASWDWGDIAGSAKKIIKQSFVQRGIEGSEEVFTSLANLFSAKLTGNTTKYKNNYDALINSRKVSPSEASRIVTKQFFTDLLTEDFLGGFIAGGGELNYITGAIANSQAARNAAAPIVNYQQNRGYRNIGSGFVNNENVGELIKQGQQSGSRYAMDLANELAQNPIYQQQIQRPVQQQQNTDMPEFDLFMPEAPSRITEDRTAPVVQDSVKPTRKQMKDYKINVGKLGAAVAKENADKAFNGNQTALKEAIKEELKNNNIEAKDYIVDVVSQVYNGGELSDYGKNIAESIDADKIVEAVKANAPEIQKEAERISTEAFERVKNVQAMANTDFSERVSKTGEVINTETGKAVELGEFVKDGDNGITLTTKDGGRVNVADLQFSNPTQAALYTQVDASGFNAEIANQVIRGFDGKGTAAVNSYMNGMLEGMAYGRTHQDEDMNFSGPFFSDLSAPQKNLAIRLGNIERGFDTEKAIKKINELKALSGGVQRKGSITGVPTVGLNDQQRSGAAALEMLVNNGALTNNFHFFASGTRPGSTARVVSREVAKEIGLANPGNKEYVSAPNGFYVPKTGDIYLDINAGNNGEGTVLFTAAHELTHFVKLWSPEKFNDLAGFLVESYHGKGVNVDRLVRDQMRKAAKSGREMSYDDAFEEFVADSMQTMFTDGDLASKLMALRERDKTLFDKIVDFIRKLRDDIVKAYKNLSPFAKESDAGKALEQISSSIDKLADMFAEGITEATENYNATDASNLSAKEIKELKAKGLSVVNGLIVADNLEALAAQVRKPGSLNIYSYRTEPEWEKSVIAQWGDTEETRRYINAVKAFTDAMVADDAIRKIVPMGSYLYDTHGPLRENQEYVVTFDMDTSCPRTFQFTKYRDHLQTYAKRPLTYNESVNLLELMRVYGQNIPCSYCYVENKRVLLSASYNNFFAYRNDVLNEKDPKKAMKKMYGYNAKKGVLSDAAQKAFDNWRSDMNYNPTVQDIWDATQTARNSVFNFLDDQLQRGNINIKNKQSAIEELVCDHFGVKGQTPRAEVSGFVSEWIYDTFAEKEHTYFKPNNTDVSEVDVRALALNHEALGYAKSSSSAKLVSSYVPYTDQLKNIDPKTKAYVIGMGGIRKHSSNDFRIDYVQDYLMFYADLAAGGWTGHTYTKSPDFVKIFGNTGDRINMSIAMTDGPNGEVRENELEGMYWKVAKELRNAYKNAGVMSMVTSDAQLSYALNADWIDMIIPFHASSLDKHVWYDLRHWFDYTSKQLERFYSSKDMKLALIQKALNDAGVEYSSDDMKQKLIQMAKEKGAGALSKDTDKIKQAEISRLVKLAAKNGVQFNNKMSAKEIETAYNTAFGVKTLYNAEGKRIKPHFLPGETVVDGVTIPGHGNDVQKYLDLCREYGVHPRFDGVAVQDKNGNYINVVDHEGYLKLIKETARTDSDQEKIQFNFDKYDDYLKMTPMEYALQQLHDNADIGMYDNMSEDPMGIQKKFIDDYLGKNRDIGWLPEYAEDFKEYREEQQNKENTGDIEELPGYEGIKQSARTDEFPDRVDSDVDTSNPDYHYSARITDPTLLDSLNNQEYITTYRTMQIIDGGLYSPMNSQEDVDASGKRALGFRSELGQWEMATEAPEKTKPKKLKSGEIVWTYDLKDPHGDTQAVAYNPYEHSANYVLNDQFTGAYKRKNIVVVECRVPVSEANGAYRAEKAHNATGWTSWHKGPVAAKIAKATKNSANPFDRRLFLSRYLMPVRIVPDAEVARMYGDYLRGTGVDVNWNVVSPSLLEELVKQGVPVTDKPSSASVKDKMPENLRQMMNQTRGEDVPKFSARDQEYMELAQDPKKNAKRLADLVEEAAKEAFPNSKLIQDGKFHKMWHHTNKEFTSFLPGTSPSTGGLKGIYFTPQETSGTSNLGKIHKAFYLNVENPKFAIGIASDKEYVTRLKSMQAKATNREQLADINRRFKNETGVDAFFDWQNGWYNIMTPEQIKSADPVTYDNDGNVIPLSERFNAESPDIRYSARDSDGNQLTKAQADFFKDSKIRDEDGNLLVVYHGTDADFTVGVPVTDKPSSASVKDKMPENLRQMMNQTRGEGVPKFSFRDMGEEVADGVYISDKEFKNNSKFSYKNAITSGLKKGETRFTRNALLDKAARTGERIAIVQSGTGDSAAYATTKIGEPEWIPAKDWEKRRKDTRVPKGSVYDLKPGESGKWYYPFVDLHVLPKPIKQATNSAYGAKFSARDSEGNILTQEQQEYFKDSKIRDEDGNLLVVYHGTDADFTVFDRTKGRANMDIQGMFFSPWDIDAAGYGSNVQAYYLNIKNPAPEGLAYKALNLYKGQNNAGVKARNYLEKKGYDGVNNGNEEFIAFNSEQIKKVNNRKPTDNPDVRFSDREYMNLARDPEANRDRLAELVNVAASMAGYDSVKLYHGTDQFGFTNIRPEAGDDGRSFFVTDSLETAKTYSYDRGVRPVSKADADILDDLFESSNGVYQLFANTEGFLRIEGGRNEWDEIPLGKIIDDYNEWHGGEWVTRAKTREIAEFAKNAGYPGVKISHIYDHGGKGEGIVKPASVYVFFNPQEQLKSADLVTYDDNGNVIPLSERFNPVSTDLRYSERDPDAMDTRTVLSNALLDAAQNDVERKYIEDYQSKIQAMNEEQNRLNELRAEIRNLSFAPGPRDKKHINDLRTEANKIANRIATYDKQLLRLESMKGIQNVVEREKAKVKARVQKQQAEYLASYKQQAETQRQDLANHYNERVRKIREDWRNRRTEAVAEVREKNRERNEKRKKRMSANAYISRIEDTIRDLMPRLQHKNAKTAIPSIFAEPAAKFLSAFDTRTFLKDGTVRPGEANVSREELREALSNLATSIDTVKLEARYGNMDLDPNMVDWINDVKDWLDTDYFVDGMFVLHKMPSEILKELYETVTSLKTAINDATKLYRARAEDVSGPGHSTITHVSKLPSSGNALLGRAGRLFRWLYAQPSSVFDRFGEGGRTIFKGLMTGQKTEAENVQKILDFTDSTYTRDEVNKWREELHKVTVNGKEYNIPTSYIMELYCLMQDSNAPQHILNPDGGIRFDDLELGRGLRGRGERFRNTKISADEVNAMLNLLTPRQKEVASKLQEFMDRIGADWGNEISFARFGYDAFGEESTGIKNYYPIRTIAEGTKIEAEAKRNNNIYALLNKSFTKERQVNAKNAVIVSDIFTTFSNHMSEMAVYNSWALPVIDLIKWYNYSEGTDDNGNEVSVKEAFRVAFNGNADEYITGLLGSINSQRSGGLSESIFFRGLRMVNRVAVAGNIRVAVQQPFSISRAMEEINPRYFRALTPAQRRTDHEEMLKYSSFGRWKEMGYYDVDIARPIQTQILKNETVADRVTERSMVLAERGDRFTWDTLWHACKLEALHNGKSGEELLKAAADKFDDVIARTQVVDSVLTKSQWMRSDKYMYRMTSAFMSEPMTSYNALLRRYDKYVQDAATHGGKYAFAQNWWPVTRSLGVFLITQLLNAIVTAPIDAMRDDDDYKTWAEKMMERFKKSALENIIPTSMMPFLSDIVDYAFYGNVDRADLSVYTKAIDLAKKYLSLLEKDENGNRVKPDKFKRNNIIMGTLQAISTISGLPLSNFARDAISIYNTVVGDVIDLDAVQSITGMEDRYGVWKFQTAKDKQSVGYQQFLKAMLNGDDDRVDYLYYQMASNGIDDDKMYNGIWEEFKKMRRDLGEEESDNLMSGFMRYFGKAEDGAGDEEAEMRSNWMRYSDEFKNSPLTNYSSYQLYWNTARPVGIDIESYEKYYTALKGATGVDENGDGKIDNNSKKAAIINVIDSFDFTDAQKDALLLNEYADTNLSQTPWHTGERGEKSQIALQLSRNDYQTYIETVEPTGIEINYYKDFLDGYKNAKGIDANGDGKADNGTKKAEVIGIINGMPLTNKQKDTLYLLKYSIDGLKDTPWH